MDSFGFLLEGFATAATPMNLLLALLGVMIGTAVGVLPGIGPAMTVALLLPITYSLEPTGAMIMLAGIFYGGMYGGSTTSILLNTPGESSSVVTAIEGNMMAKGGRAAQALATAAIGSFVAGTIGTLLLAFTAPYVTRFAISLGAPEYFAVMLLAFIAVTAVLGSSRLRGCHLADHGAGHRADRDRRRQRAGAAHLRHLTACRRYRHRDRRSRHLRRRRSALGGRPPAPQGSPT